MMYAYGIYLMNGGTPEGFQQMDIDDVQILLTSYTGSQNRLVHNIAETVAKMFGSSDE